MYTLIVPHLGDSTPLYLMDCIHQVRLWNSPAELLIIILLDRCHQGAIFWSTIARDYAVAYVYTDQLEHTQAHSTFHKKFKGDMAFRKGYWKYVIERFFYVEECMQAMNLTNVIALEYDVLVYTHISTLIEKLKQGKQVLHFVCDNHIRGHPGCMYIPTAKTMGDFCKYIVDTLTIKMCDMDLLSNYAKTYKERVSYLPVITNKRNHTKQPRVSALGHTESNPFYLSENAERLGMLFDSAVVGQYVGGIDPRNTQGHKIQHYINESSLYSMNEMPFQWIRVGNKWQPQLDNTPLATIHVHSKALKQFLSDRESQPTDDYNIQDVLQQLVQN
jgi:hypothetical protein